jgi:transposase
MHDQLTRLLGLEGFAVTSVEQGGDGLEIEIELAVPAGCCPGCGRGSVEVKDRPVVAVRDLPIAGRRTLLCWRKRRFRCRGCGGTFTETHSQLPPRQRVTRRFRARLFERAREGAAHAEIARGEETTRYQVERAFALAAAGQLASRIDERLPRRLSLDEAHHRRGRGGEYATVVSDPDRRRVVEVLQGRSRRDLERYLRSLTSTQRQAIEVVSIDPYEAYRLALRAELPRARIVCDPFHLVRGANEALDLVRRERQRGARSHYKRTRQGTPRQGWRQDLYQARRRLLKARERLSERQRESLCQLFAREPLVAEAWGLKEAFRDIYRAPDRAEAEARLQHFLGAVERAALPSFDSFARAVRLWREELLAYFEEPVTNGYAEGVINKVKVIKRRAYGLPSFQGFRRRVLVACG